LVVAVLMVSRGAVAGTVNFDDYTFSSSLAYAAPDRYLSLGIAFNRAIPVANVSKVEPQNYQYFLDAGGSAPNALYLSSSTGLSIEVTFVVPGSMSPATTNYVRILAFDAEIGSILGYLFAYDVNGNLIDQDAHTTPAARSATLEVSTPGIARVIFQTDSDGAQLDNLFFTTPWGTVPSQQTTWGRIKALCE
jgi:hypothetical protein